MINMKTVVRVYTYNFTVHLTNREIEKVMRMSVHTDY